MKLIDEIKKAEEKAEKIRKEAEIEGQKLLEKERANAAKNLAQLDDHRDKVTEKKLAQAKQEADHDIERLEQQHKTEIKKIKESYSKNQNKAIISVQDIILKWPSSR